jgi:HEPN domain-containing protein
MVDTLVDAKEWRDYADTDLRTAEHIAKDMWPVPFGIVAYHCQQAAEKYLKGFLILQDGNEPPHIHDLKKLCDLCKKYKPEFEKIELPCNILTTYAGQPRYPLEIFVDEPQMKMALHNASEIKKFAQQIMPEAFTPAEPDLSLG